MTGANVIKHLLLLQIFAQSLLFVRIGWKKLAMDKPCSIL
jgi:hypothetical protein